MSHVVCLCTDASIAVRTLFLFLFLVPTCLYADWQVAKGKGSRTGSGKWSVAELAVCDDTHCAEVQLVYFARNTAQWNIVPNLNGALDGVQAAVRSVNGLAGVNGGYFKLNLDPLGLLISKGKSIHPLQKAQLLSGIFAIRNGHPELRRVAKYAGSKGVSEAIQCGPFLVDNGRPVPGLNASHTAARTFIFTCNSSIWGIGICRSVTLAEMGNILAKAKLIPEHRITHALNFDGGSSTTFYVKLPDREISSTGVKVVSNYLVIRERP